MRFHNSILLPSFGRSFIPFLRPLLQKIRLRHLQKIVWVQTHSLRVSLVRLSERSIDHDSLVSFEVVLELLVIRFLKRVEGSDIVEGPLKLRRHLGKKRASMFQLEKLDFFEALVIRHCQFAPGKAMVIEVGQVVEEGL